MCLIYVILVMCVYKQTQLLQANSKATSATSTHRTRPSVVCDFKPLVRPTKNGFTAILCLVDNFTS